MSEPRVRMCHLRALGYCSRGIRRWCAARGVDYAALLKDGIAVSEIERLGDALADRACALTKGEAA